MKQQKSPFILITIIVALLVVIGSSRNWGGKVGTPEELAEMHKQEAEQQAKIAQEDPAGKPRATEGKKEVADLAKDFKKSHLPSPAGPAGPYESYIFQQKPAAPPKVTANESTIKPQWYREGAKINGK